MTLRMTLLAFAAAAGLSACGDRIEGTYCVADAGKLVFKGGKVATDTGEPAGTYTVQTGEGVTFTDKFGVPKTFTRQPDGMLVGDFKLTPCK